MSSVLSVKKVALESKILKLDSFTNLNEKRKKNVYVSRDSQGH